MNKIQKFIHKTREIGFLGTLKFILNKYSGYSGAAKCQEEIDTLYYFLNNYVDITALPPAKGSLRKLQLCDAVMLKVFDNICRHEGWTYWLSWGTLLGAVRHKGFIPWDDDLDICMMRDDFNKAGQKLPEILASYGKDTLTFGIAHKGWQYLHWNRDLTGIWCDIFPVDTVYTSCDDETYRKNLLKEVSQYKKAFEKRKNSITYDEMDRMKKHIVNAGGGSIAMALHEAEFSYTPLLCRMDAVLPVSTVEFEGYTLSAPHDTHRYLTEAFGDYMQFPREGVEHHDAGTGTPLSGWADVHGTDMDEVLDKLKDIEKFFRS